MRSSVARMWVKAVDDAAARDPRTPPWLLRSAKRCAILSTSAAPGKRFPAPHRRTSSGSPATAPRVWHNTWSGSRRGRSVSPSNSYLQLPALDTGAISDDHERRRNQYLFLRLRAQYDGPPAITSCACDSRRPSSRRRSDASSSSDTHPRLGPFASTPRGQADDGRAASNRDPCYAHAQAQPTSMPDRFTFARSAPRSIRPCLRRSSTPRRSSNGIGPEPAIWVGLDRDRAGAIRRQAASAGASRCSAFRSDDKSAPPSPENLRQAFERFAQEAFRGRTPQAGYVDRLVGIYETRRKAGDKTRGGREA